MEIRLQTIDNLTKTRKEYNKRKNARMANHANIRK